MNEIEQLGQVVEDCDKIQILLRSENPILDEMLVSDLRLHELFRLVKVVASNLARLRDTMNL